MKFKVIGLIICLAFTVLCFAGCKNDGLTSSETSTTVEQTQSGSANTNSEDEITESELDEILNEWESNVPTLDIGGGSSDKTDDTTVSSDSNNTTSEDNSDGTASENNSDGTASGDNSDDTDSSSETEDTDSSSETEDTESDEDDGYFDVAV